MYFALGMIAVSLWTLAAGAGYSAVPLNFKVIFAKIEAIGYNTALPLFILFAIYHANLEKWGNKKWLHTLLFLISISNILLIITNELHGWVWTGFSPVEGNVVVFEHGPGFIWVASTGYLMIASLLVILWLASRKGPEISRKQSRLLLYASLFPIIANIFYLYEIKGTEGVDWSSVTFSVTGFLFLRAIYGTRLLDLVPVARDKLFRSLSDGMIVLDMQNRIIDINQAAADMIASTPALLLGKDFTEVTPFAQSFLGEPPEQEIKAELGVGIPNKLYFDVLISPLREVPEKFIGRLIIFRNITERKENELRLLQLIQAVEQSPISVVITDEKGFITFVSPFFTTLTGYTPSEAIGTPLNIVQSRQTPDEAYQEMWQTVRSGRKWEGELLNKKKNGDLYWEHEVIAPVLDANGNIYSFIAVKQDITERKLAEQTLENRFLEIQTLNKDLQEAQTQIVAQQRALATAEERQRLGRNLHDSVNQSIHSLMLFSETLIALLQNGETEQAIRAAERIHESGEQALKEVRLLVHEGQVVFMGGYLGLIQAVENRLNMVERRVGIQADFSYDLFALERSPQEWIENLYWIILEGLNNSLKHSQASRVHVSMVDDVNRLTVEVKDNGAGFAQSQAGGGGFGMKSMHERAKFLGGVLSVESSPGHGTRVKCVMEIPRP